MVDAPVRIRVAQDGDGFWTCREAVIDSPEYVRADLFAQLEAENERLKLEITKATDPAYLEEKLRQIGITDSMAVQALASRGAVKVKALEALGNFAFWFRKYPEFIPNSEMLSEMLADLEVAKPFIPTSRALGGKKDG